jgi:hypothetical protein
MDARTHWTDAARARHFIVPDDAELAPGSFALRTATGRERSVDESAVAAFEVTEEEARAWAKEQLGAVFGELRGQTLDFVEKLRQKTAEMKEENRRAWDQAVADAPPEVREAGSQLRDMLKDLGATLRRAAREHGYDPDAPDGESPSSASASASADPATSTTSADTTGSAASVDADASVTSTTSVDVMDADASAASVDAEASAAAAVDATTPAAVEADARPSSDNGPDAPPAADHPPISGNAARRVDAPAIRLRAEP